LQIIRKTALLLVSAALLTTLAACTDNSPENPDSGSGAGDDSQDSGNEPDAETAAALLALVGTYDIQGMWNGLPDDEALLVVRTPFEAGMSEVVIYDFLPDRGNCFSALPAGIASLEPVGDRVFLDRILQFDDAILSLSGSTLRIDYFDTFDFDGDGDTQELISYTAESVALMESDIQPLCP